MNNKPIEQALATLLPTHAHDLPPELVSLAVSFVAQSRSFSSSLKPEEEIARPFACAEIACKRLSRALKLPPSLGHPPCPPRVYKKLYAFLDQSLAPKTSITGRVGRSSVSGTASRKSSAPSTPTKGSHNVTRTPSRATPITAAATSPFKSVAHTPSKSSPLKRTRSGTPKTARQTKVAKPLPLAANGLSRSTAIPDAPTWVMPAIRNVCRTLSTAAPRTTTWLRPPISKTLPPHIFAGVSSVLYFVSQLSPTDIDSGDSDSEMYLFLETILSMQQEQSGNNMRKSEEDIKELVYALIVAVYFIALARRRHPVADQGDGKGASSDEAVRQMDNKTFSEMRQAALACLGLPPAEKDHCMNVEFWISLIMEMGWSSGQEWLENIPTAGMVGGDDATHSSYGEPEDERENAESDKTRTPSRRSRASYKLIDSKKGEDSRRGLLPGLGTMMQERVDWLSEDRCEDYLRWKEDILARIDRR